METNSEIKCCKSCGKELPENYEHDYCEACMNKISYKIKKGLVVAGGIALTVIPIIFFKKKK